MNWVDVAGIFGIILIFLVYMIVSPMLEGKKGKGKNNLGFIDEIGRKIKDAVRWMNRQ